MARIAGIDLPNKHTDIALNLYFWYRKNFCEKLSVLKTGVDPEKRINDLTAEEVNELRKLIENEYKVEGSSEIRSCIEYQEDLWDIGCYRGLRHRRGLPVNGQRTKTNAPYQKGKG